MPTPEELMRQAEEYRRLAPSCTTPGLPELLLSIANDLERAAGLTQATGQQQQQVQPKKDDE